MPASAETKALTLQVDASVELLRAQLRSGSGEVDRFTRDAQRTLDRFDGRMAKVGAGGMPQLTGSLSRIKGLLSAAAVAGGGLSVFALGKGFLDGAEKAKQLDAQLRLATATFGSFAQAQSDVQRISADTRSGLEETTKLYATFLRTSEQTGHSQDDAARATETFGKALKIGGAGAAEAASAILQFSQALGSGVLRGDEFNSIAEASPRVLKLLADAMGVSQGAVRGLAAEGKITGDVLYRALTDRKFTAGIDAEFNQLPVSIGDAMTAVQNAAITTFGAFDKGGQFSNAIVGFIGDGTDGFTKMGQGAQDAGVQARAAFDGLASALDPFVAAVESATGFAHSKFIDLRNDIGQILGLIDEVKNIPIGISNYASRWDQQHLSWLPGYSPAPIQARSDMRGRFERSYDASSSRAQARLAPPATPSQGVLTLSAYVAGVAGTKGSAGGSSSAAQAIVAIQKDIATLEGQRRAATGSALGIIRSEIAERQREIGYLRQGIAPELAKQAAKADGTAATRATSKSERAIAATAKRSEKQWEDTLKAGREALEKLRDFQPRDINGEADAAFSRLGIDPRGDLRAIVDNIDTRRDVRQDDHLKQFDRPLASYRGQLRDATDDMGKALEGVAVDGLGAVENGFVGVIAGTKSVSAAFKEMAATIVADNSRVGAAA